MRKITEILRLHYEQKLGQRQIARGASVSQSTVHEYLARAKAAGIEWPLPNDWDEQRLVAALFPAVASEKDKRATKRHAPDFAHIRQQGHRCLPFGST